MTGHAYGTARDPIGRGTGNARETATAQNETELPPSHVHTASTKASRGPPDLDQGLEDNRGRRFARHLIVTRSGYYDEHMSTSCVGPGSAVHERRPGSPKYSNRNAVR